MKGYQLTKAFYAEHSTNEAMQIGCTGNHHSLYTWICELRNQIQTRNPGREVMDLPTRYTMAMAFIGSDHTLKKCINHLAEWGIIEIVSKEGGKVTKVKLAAEYLNRHSLLEDNEPSQLCDSDESGEDLENDCRKNAIQVRQSTEGDSELSAEPSQICDLSATVQPTEPAQLSHICDLGATVDQISPFQLSQICDLGATVGKNDDPELSHICDLSANNKNNIKQNRYILGGVSKKNEVDPPIDPQDASSPTALPTQPVPTPTPIDTAVKHNTAGRMIKPTLEELTAYVLTQAGGTIPMAETMFDFYTSKGWKVGRETMKDWNAAARRWVRENKDKPTTHIPTPQNPTTTAKRPTAPGQLR
ncbi:hypothetical protein WBJ53_14910 [Spirosoma sp. SC4-14]|uniref:hypothetical protein n=1 Tax=Spirosoma sp. SC4-14 TaxID=3128900 RepID=UPI0030D035CF